MSASTAYILIIDDDTEIRYSLRRVLSARGYEVNEADSGESGVASAQLRQPEVVFLDNRMAGMNGIETLQHLRSVAPQAMIILMTAFGTTQTAIEAMKFGAYDYIIKPFDLKKVLSLTESAVKAHRDLHQSSESGYQRVLDSEDYQEGLVGSSEPMQEVFKVIGQVAASEVTVMITGESGTGKEVVARSIVQHSLRADKPYTAVNCAAIPENLIESELFGHEKGAFTGATASRQGKFELCDGGTIFLDEIGDMELATQTKILRTLQEGEIQRVGGSETRKVDVRVIAATNKDLEQMVEDGTFREDLYYRLNVMRIRLPALRERKSDIPALIDFILQRLVKARKTRVCRISEEALRQLQQYDWPGNVRELENVVQRSVVVSQGDTILAKDLPPEVFSPGERRPTHSPFREGAEPGSAPAAGHTNPDAGQAGDAPEGDVPAPLAKVAPALDLTSAYDQLYLQLRAEADENLLQLIERAMIERVLAETGGNQVKASQLLGMTRATLRKRIEQFGLSR